MIIGKVVIIDPDIIAVKEVDDHNRPLHLVFHDLLDGYFEIVHCVNLPKGILMLVDDEGLLKNLTINPVASRLYSGWIAGRALIMRECRNEYGEPDIVGLTDYDVNRVLRSIHNVVFGN